MGLKKEDLSALSISSDAEWAISAIGDTMESHPITLEGYQGLLVIKDCVMISQERRHGLSPREINLIDGALKQAFQALVDFADPSLFL